MIYADYNATYPLSAKHIAALSQRLLEAGSNPSSLHAEGRQAKLALEEGRERVASLLGCARQEIIFTSGATESNNWAIKAVTLKHKSTDPQHLVATASEHPSVLSSLNWLKEHGFATFDLIPSLKNGVIDADALLSLLRNDTRLVALIHVNNEVGSINPVFELAEKIRAKAKDAHIHVDGVQAFGKLDLSPLKKSEIDSYAVSGHKIGSLSGIGALYLKQSSRLSPWHSGGSQERGMRAGTENLAGAISMGMRCQEIHEHAGWLDHLPSLKDRLIRGFKEFPQIVLHGDTASSLANTLNFHIVGISLTKILTELDRNKICVSSQSACSAGQMKPSHVLLAMGYDNWVSSNSIRISLGEGSQAGEVDQIIDAIRRLF